MQAQHHRSPHGKLQAQPEDTARLHVFMRGVMWRSAELNSARVWHQISQSWAVPFAMKKSTLESTDARGSHSSAQAPSEQVTSHKGITEMAHELYGVIWQHIQQNHGLHHLPVQLRSFPIALGKLNTQHSVICRGVHVM